MMMMVEEPRPPSPQPAAPPPPPGAPAIDAEWFYIDGDDQFGPVGADFFGSAVIKGELDASTVCVWTEGMDEWLPIEQAPGLVEVLYKARGR